MKNSGLIVGAVLLTIFWSVNTLYLLDRACGLFPDGNFWEIWLGSK